MSDKFSTISIQRLYHLLFADATNKQILGIPENIFYKPSEKDKLSTCWIEQKLETPIGVAAGPHSQMAQNIISAWLCGARYIELKTIQTLDELEVSKPCIDMQDEGYNCEWSQELKIKESFEEYLHAWILIHVLKHKFGWNNSKELGTIFNMSVGYNMDGILKDNVQWFFEKMNNCKAEKEEKIKQLKSLYPAIEEIDIPDCISNNITLSTMHGCPPEEIEKIGLYLIENKKLNTIIKLNPTLLGDEKLRKILNEQLGFKTNIPDIAFEHDLKYKDAITIINSLNNSAKKNNVFFGIKLTNTLESINHKNIFNANEKMMYMSGRALHPISINVADMMQTAFEGKLNISFSAGADCFNIVDILKCGLSPVTVCSDILKPGGYGRLSQYLEEINGNTTELNNINKKVALEYLHEYAKTVCNNTKYQRKAFHEPSIKTKKELKYFDCIAAPCINTCPGEQNIPEYMYYTARGEYDKAYQTIIATNPFPNVLGMVCDHLCQTKCTRINYDNNLLIREVKRFVSEQNKGNNISTNIKPNNIKVAVIGAGPSGLSCAYYLALSGFDVNVFETKDMPGGMVSDAIPAFRLTNEAIQKDIKRIEQLGVKISYNSKINSEAFEKLQNEFQFIYLAVGAQVAKKMRIEGEEANGIYDPLKFLSDIRRGKKYQLGNKVAVIGGGNTAMDVVRTVKRLIDKDSKVVLIYRRTIKEMPADEDEIKAVINEGIEIMELTTPEKVIVADGKLKSLVCSKFKLGETDQSGRAQPVKIGNSDFTIDFDAVIPAIGQDVHIDFLNTFLLQANPDTFETKIKNVFIGGDALRGAKNIITAVADGRKVAENIISSSQIQFNLPETKAKKELIKENYLYKRSRRNYGIDISEKTLLNNNKQTVDIAPLSEVEAKQEASRCLYCDDICNVCVTVCPNRANYAYEQQPITYHLQKAVKKENDTIAFEEDAIFKVTQQYQVLNIADFCNECGNCTTFCPTSGAPFKDKPKFHLTIKSFNETDNGYYLSKISGKLVLILKEKNQIKTLTLHDNKFTYETDQLIATFKSDDFRLIDVKFLVPCVVQSNFAIAAEMSVLIRSAENLYTENNLY